MIVMVICAILFVAGWAYLLVYLPRRTRAAYDRWLARFEIKNYDGCMGEETRYHCKVCESQRVRSHAGGFDWSPYWMLSQTACDACRRDAAAEGT